MNAVTPAMEEMKIGDSLQGERDSAALEETPSVEDEVSRKSQRVATPCWQTHLQQKLYDRSEEQVLLQRSFQVMQKKTHNAMLLLITGPSGTGKTRLAKTLKEPVTEKGGYFLTGKFNQSCRPEPYTAFVSALTEFTHMVMERGDKATASVSKAIHEAVGSDICVLTSMIPGLERILGRTTADESTSSTKAKASDAISRFVYVFRKFMRAVCSPDQPMVLLLDDLQWADPCSLDLLMSVVTDTGNEGIVLVATCRDNVSPSDYLSRKLREMEDKDNVGITNISLSDLSETVIATVVSNALALSQEESAALGGIVCRQTQGNVFYMIEFLRWLQSSDLLYYDHISGSWKWDEDEIHLTINVCQVGDFLVDQLEQLPGDVKEVLKVVACLGTYLNEELIAFVLKKSIGNELVQAAKKGVLTLNEARGSYAFAHDGWEEAAYRLISKDELELFHLEIGRRLWRCLDSDELDLHLFIVLSQMMIGRKLITREKERMSVASLCLHAAKKAAKSSTFRIASIYLNFGVELVGTRGWRDDYHLTLAVYNAAAEMEMCTANFERMEQYLKTVFENARPTDQIQSYATKIYALGVSDRALEAIDTGINVLKELGETFPNRLCSAHVMSEVRTVRKLLKGKSDAQLLRLPTLANEQKLAAMQILQLIYLNALLVRPKFAPFVILKLLKLTLQYGLSVFASAAFSGYGMLCVGTLGEVDEGFRFGELGMTLLERFKANEFLPRVYAAFYGCIYAWKKPLKDVLEPLRRAHHIGLQTGDIEFACLCANLYCFSAVDAGVPLQSIEHEWHGFHEVMHSNRQKGLLIMALPSVQVIHHYMGLSEDPLSAKGDLMDFDEALQSAIDNKRVISMTVIRLYRMQVAYVFNDYETAAEHIVGIEDLWQIPPTFERASSLFFGGLVALQMARENKQKRKSIKSAKAIIKLFKKWATHTPHNCLDKLFLLEAELECVFGRNAKAYEKYTCAIALAADSKFLMMHALANERAARHLMAIGSVAQAEPFFRKACLSYDEWGGKAKLERLQAEVESIYRS
jgi:predicted ATPase